MRSHHSLVCMATALLCSFLIGEANAEDVCDDYAARAAAEANEAVVLGCGYTGPRWSTSGPDHRNWCWGSVDDDTGDWTYSNFHNGAASAESQARAEDLLKCRNCVAYAGSAVADNSENNSRKCGLTGPRWHGNATTHLRWCLGVAPWDAQSETTGRQKQLGMCK